MSGAFREFDSLFDPNRFDATSSDAAHQWQMERQQDLRFDTAELKFMNLPAVAEQAQKEMAAQQATNQSTDPSAAAQLEKIRQQLRAETLNGHLVQNTTPRPSAMKQVGVR